jgi:hypothetical protein
VNRPAATAAPRDGGSTPRAVTPETWTAVARVPLGRPARLLAGALADRADDRGRVRASAAELAASTCLSVTTVADVLADLASRGLLARDGHWLVLLRPDDGEGAQR